MIPILTSEQMRIDDAKAVARRGTEALVRAAGTAVAFEATRMLSGAYGRRIAVIAGPGLNGADGRVAGSWLRDRGAHVDIINVADQPASLRGYDLLIDAAFGLGCTRAYVAPALNPSTKVLAVDLPSGVDANSGDLLGSPPRADVTVALGALKFAHVTGVAATIMGELRFAGLDIVSEFSDGLVEDSDLDDYVKGAPNDHKWSHAITAMCGSEMMPGAAHLVVRGALAGGASMVRLATRGDLGGRAGIAPEVVLTYDVDVDARCRAVVAGPGLGRGSTRWLIERLKTVKVPVVLDADALTRKVLATRPPDAKWIVTPHEGEFARLRREHAYENRIDAVRSLARDTGCVVLLKGPTTVLADPEGTLRVVRSGTAALATAGSGDVLAGLIAGAIARGHSVLDAGALSAHLHGLAGRRLGTYSTTATLSGAIGAILDERATTSRMALARFAPR